MILAVPEIAADDAEDDEAEYDREGDVEGLAFGGFGGRLVVDGFLVDFDADGWTWDVS